MWRLAALFLFPVSCVFAQFQAGVKLGTPVNDFMHFTGSSARNDANVTDA
jgi:hypothetical protein